VHELEVVKEDNTMWVEMFAILPKTKSSELTFPALLHDDGGTREVRFARTTAG